MFILLFLNSFILFSCSELKSIWTLIITSSMSAVTLLLFFHSSATSNSLLCKLFFGLEQYKDIFIFSFMYSGIGL